MIPFLFDVAVIDPFLYLLPGIIVGVAIVFAIVVAVCIIIVYHRRKKKEKEYWDRANHKKDRLDQ